MGEPNRGAGGTLQADPRGLSRTLGQVRIRISHERTKASKKKWATKAHNTSQERDFLRRLKKGKTNRDQRIGRKKGWGTFRQRTGNKGMLGLSRGLSCDTEAEQEKGGGYYDEN